MAFAAGDAVEYVGEASIESATMDDGGEVRLTLRPGDLGTVIEVEPDGHPVVSWPDAGTLVMSPQDVRAAR